MVVPDLILVHRDLRSHQQQDTIPQSEQSCMLNALAEHRYDCARQMIENTT